MTGTAAGGRNGWWVTFGSMYCLIFGPSAILVSGFGVFVQPLSVSFGWSPGQIGFAISLLALSMVIVAPLQGILIDRCGARATILWSIPALAIGLFALNYLPDDIHVFYGAWVLLSLLAVGVWPASYLKAVSSWFDRRLGLAIGIANAGVGLGVILIPPIEAMLIHGLGWRRAYVSLGAMVLLTWPVALLVRERAQGSGVRQRPGADPLNTRALWRQRTFRLLALGYFLLGITGTGLVAGLIPILISRGLSEVAAVSAMSLFGVAALGGRLLTGWLLDRYFVSRVIIAFVTLVALATAALAHGLPPSLALAVAPLLGLIMGAEFDVLAYATRRYYGLAAFGRAYGNLFGLFQLGAALGAALLSVTAQRTHSFTAGLWIYAAALALSIPVFARLGPYEGGGAVNGGSPADVEA